jgi:hypothetical protein
LTPSLKKTMLFNAGMLYIFAVLSTFRVWQQSILNSKSTLHKQHPWKQKLKAIFPGLSIALTLYSFISNVLTNQPTTDVITQAVSGLPLILVCVELIFQIVNPAINQFDRNSKLK